MIMLQGAKIGIGAFFDRYCFMDDALHAGAGERAHGSIPAASGCRSNPRHHAAARSNAPSFGA